MNEEPCLARLTPEEAGGIPWSSALPSIKSRVHIGPHAPNIPDDVVSYADLKPGDPVLEIGCGTGQATKSFATRGLQIVAIDPGSELVRAARESLAHFGTVELVETTCSDTAVCSPSP